MSDYFYALICLLFWFGGLYLLMRPQLNNNDAKRAMVARDSVMDLRGVRRGTRVIGSELEWTERQPSFATWKEENERTNNVKALQSVGRWMAFFDIALILYNLKEKSLTSFVLVGILLWAPVLLIFPILFIGIANDFRKSKGRSDGGPVPIAVRRRTSIELTDQRYFFVLESQHEGGQWQLEVFKPWDDIIQFREPLNNLSIMAY